MTDSSDTARLIRRVWADLPPFRWPAGRVVYGLAPGVVPATLDLGEPTYPGLDDRVRFVASVALIDGRARVWAVFGEYRGVVAQVA